MSILFLGFGILGGYLWNNLEQTRKRPLFIVDKAIGGKGEDCRVPARAGDGRSRRVPAAGYRPGLAGKRRKPY